MRIQWKLFGALACSSFVVVLIPATSGALTIGNNLSNAPNNATCIAMAGPTTCSLSQVTLKADDQTTGGLVAPVNGVITKWRLRTGATNTFRAALRTFDGDHAIASESPQNVPTTEGVHEFDTRVPIATGNRIGLDIYNDSIIMAAIPIVYNTGAPDSEWDYWSPAVTDGSTIAPSGSQGDIGLLLNADIEPDADSDGYGDTTQDLCPTNAAAQGACPAPTVPTVPDKPAIAWLDISQGNKRIYVNATVASTLTLTFERKTAGRKAGGRCKASARSGKRCTIYKKIGASTAAAAAGINVVQFAGRVGGKKLKRGSYRVNAVASTPQGGKSVAMSAEFKIR
jgi:hypothetical protein